MNILRLAGELFLLYLLYKLIFDFIIPIYNTTRKVKKQFGEMHQQMQEQMKKTNQTEPSSKSAVPKEDYIDYEEVL